MKFVMSIFALALSFTVSAKSINYCQIAIFNENTISTTEVVMAFLDLKVPERAMVSGVIDLSRRLKMSNSQTAYAVTIKNTPKKELKIKITSGNGVNIEDAYTNTGFGIEENSYKEIKLEDGNTYVRSCALNSYN